MDSLLRQPITLISGGRSGTSLLQNIFNSHPDISVAGETANLIFGTWYSIEKTKDIIPQLMVDGEMISWDERVGRGVRGVFAEMFNFDSKYWMHKPIGNPFIYYNLLSEKMNIQDWHTLYWKIFLQVFPEGRFFTVLRHPFDVVISAVEYWGFQKEEVWFNIVNDAKCFLHQDSLVKIAVNFESLVLKPEQTIIDLFSELNIPYHKRVLEAFNYIHVPNKSEERQDRSFHKDKIERNFSRKHQWKNFDFSFVKEEEKDLIKKLWWRYGYCLDF